MKHGFNPGTLINIRTEGGIMLYALFISVVMVLITSLILSLNGMNGRFNESVLQKHTCRTNVKNAIILAMAEPNLFPVDKTVSFSLFEGKNDSVSITRRYWGIYETVTASSKVLGASQTQSVLVSTFWNDEELPALWLSPSQFRCKIAGNSTIEGQCKIPGLRFEKTTMNKVPFTGTIPPAGQISDAERITELPDYLIRLTFEDFIGNLPARNEMSISNPLEGYNSFANATQITFLENNTRIDKGNISGNQVIICDGILAISADVQMTDIVIIAKSIIFDDSFNGSVQAFARDSIITGGNSFFGYPSAFVVYSQNNDNLPAKISLGKESDFFGTILCWSQRPTIRNHFLVELTSDSHVTGNVFCNGFTELNGTVEGHVITKATLLHLNGGTHENTLYNCRITKNSKNKDFIGLNLMKDSKKMKNIKMLK
ncbi:MAG: hypothetical protein CVU11_06420 [Bacteroidetes bacterium HGW-Bacteroidetes-6]|nr:MAG: hypothetical protein CVU11_06420 [Bacteroidetes bacterium HGW-Bacteroidetes-6]